MADPLPAEVTTAPAIQTVAAAPTLAGRPEYQMDAQHTGRSPYAGPNWPTLLRSFDSAALPTVAPGDPRPEIQSSAAVAPDGTIYLGNFPGNLMALRDPQDGSQLELLWRFHPEGASSFHTTPALGADGTIYVGFSTGGATPEAHATFYALDSQGQVRWTVDLGGGRQTSSPTLGPDGTIYITSGAGKLFAIAPDGRTLWTAQTGPTVKASPALGQDGTVYVASMNDHLYAVQPPAAGQAEGSVRWAFRFGDYPGDRALVTAAVPPPGADGVGSGATPAVGSDGTIYVGADNSNMYAVTPDGQLKWMFEAEPEVAGIWSSAALSADGQTLYFGANRGGVYALRTSDGGLAWQYSIIGSVYNSLTLDRNGVLYTGSTAGHLIAIDSATGEKVWDFTNPDTVAIWTAPALRGDGTIVIGDTRGFVRVIGQA
ncbi:MAG TPA: PQQ-binding-like beta-propeller repeat protein [Chloroflexota bacterium]